MEFIIGVVCGFLLAVLVGAILQKRAERQADRLYSEISDRMKTIAKEVVDELTLTIEKHDDSYFAYRKHDMKFMCQFKTKKELLEKLNSLGAGMRWMTDEAGLEMIKGME